MRPSLATRRPARHPAAGVAGDGWQSDVLASGTYEHTFSRPGSYPYTCTLHLGMDGRVDVVNR